MTINLRAFTMPKWGIEMEEGLLAEWAIQEGCAFIKGQMISTIESDKISNEVEADYDGAVLRLIAHEGDTYKVGALIAVFGPEGTAEEDVDAFIKNFVPSQTAFEPDEETEPDSKDNIAPDTGDTAPSPHSEASVEPPFKLPEDAHITSKARSLALEHSFDITGISGSGSKGKITAQDMHQAMKPARTIAHRPPVDNAARVDNEDVGITATAQQLSESYDVDVAKITGTGRKGRIRRADVLNVAETTSAVKVLKYSAMRRTMAKRLTQAKQTIPHFYLNMDVEMDWLLSLRSKINQTSAIKLSVNDFIAKATARALKAVPGVNVHVFDTEIHQYRDVNLAIAVSVEGGLYTPVVKAAQDKTLEEISGEIKQLGSKAHSGKLTQDDYSGGTFTISNLGMFGITSFDAVINPPQGAILAVGAVQRLPREINHALTFQSIMQMTLSCDHRAIDGVMGAEFLNKIKDDLEHPARLLEDM